MRFKKPVALFLVLSLLVSIGSFASGAAAKTDIIKYKTVKLSYGAEFSVPSTWEQNNTSYNTSFRNTKDEDITDIKIVSSKQQKVKYKSLADFEKANVFYGKKDSNHLKVTKIKASCSRETVLDTSYVRMVDFGGWGGVYRIETAYFKTNSGNYFGVFFITHEFDMKTGVSKLDKIVPTIITSFKDVKPTVAKPTLKPTPKPTPKPIVKATVKSSRLFPVSLNGIFSYVDINGKVVLKTDYGFADDFVSGYAQIMNEFGGMSGYMDIKGNQISSLDSTKKTSKANLAVRGAREIKGDTVLDLSKKVKKYTSKEDGWEVTHEDYNINDGFEVRVSQASGAPSIRLYKNGKIFLGNNKQLNGNDIFVIVKYDNEKIIRLLYADASSGKLKTLYVDYNGNPIWTKTAQASLVPSSRTNAPAKTKNP